MKHGRLHTGPPLALQPLQAEMARKKSSPRQNNSWQREKVTSWLSRLVTLRTPYKGQCPGLFANHMIFVIYPDQNGPSRTAHPFISFVWISLLSKHFLDLTKRTFLNPGQPTLTICSVLKKKSQNENEMLKKFKFEGGNPIFLHRKGYVIYKTISSTSWRPRRRPPPSPSSPSRSFARKCLSLHRSKRWDCSTFRTGRNPKVWQIMEVKQQIA